MNAELDKLSAPTEPTVKLEVSVNDLNTILGALQELPHRIADPVLKKVFTQAQAQINQS